MGGYGSTRWNWYKKRVVAEDCRRLPFRLFKPYLQVGQGGKVTWSSDGKEISSIGYRVGGDGDSPSSITMIYTLIKAGENIDCNYPIRLITTPLPWGGVRHWFTCPGLGCGRRVNVLYLAPNTAHFRCRHCNRLSYRSRQEGYRKRATYELLDW